MVSQFLKFLGTRDGNVALSVGVLAVPLLLSAGAAIDYSSLVRVRSAMQNAADSAALAAAAADEHLGQDELKTLVKTYFGANGGNVEVSRETRVTSEIRKTFVEVKASASVNSVLMGVLGKSFTDVEVSSRANRVRSGLELALVVDTTGSMNYGMSWPDTAAAVNNLLDEFQRDTAQKSFYVTLIPFNDRVNIGTDRHNWLQETDGLEDWEGCVEPKESGSSAYPYAIDLDAIGAAFLPTVENYWSGIYDHRSVRDCANEITGPTNIIEQVSDGLRELEPQWQATGRYDSALAWGWRAVASQWAGRWDQGPDYPSSGKDIRQKVIAFFSDGKTDINKFELETARGEFGDNKGSVTTFEHFVHTCEQIKAEGIKVFIFHVLGNRHASPYFERCAGKNYYGIENGNDFVEALGELGKTGELVKLVR